MAKFGYQGLLLSIFIIGLSACDGAPAAKVDRVAQATSSAATDTPDEPVKNSFANAVSVRLFVKKWNIKEGNKYTHPLGILLGEDQRKKTRRVVDYHNDARRNAFVLCATSFLSVL